MLFFSRGMPVFLYCSQIATCPRERAILNTERTFFKGVKGWCSVIVGTFYEGSTTSMNVTRVEISLIGPNKVFSHKTKAKIGSSDHIYNVLLTSYRLYVCDVTNYEFTHLVIESPHSNRCHGNDAYSQFLHVLGLLQKITKDISCFGISQWICFRDLNDVKRSMHVYATTKMW